MALLLIGGALVVSAALVWLATGNGARWPALRAGRWRWARWAGYWDARRRMHPRWLSPTGR
jgi:hypothetical protein